MSNEVEFKIIVNAIAIIFSMVLTYIGITSEVFTALMVLMALDYITGLLASYRVLEDITSQKMKIGAIGKLGLLFLVLGIASLVKILGVDFSFLMFTVLWIIAVAEALSLVSNVHTMLTGIREKEQVVVTTLIKNLLVKVLKEKGL